VVHARVYIRTLRKQRYSDHTIARKEVVLRLFFGFLVERGLVLQDPFDFTRIRRPQKTVQKHYFVSIQAA
jgi:site-specific recombinase XerD